MNTEMDSSSSETRELLQRILKSVEPEKKKRGFEIAVAVVLSLATTASAWCAYQSKLWGGAQAARGGAARDVRGTRRLPDRRLRSPSAERLPLVRGMARAVPRARPLLAVDRLQRDDRVCLRVLPARALGDPAVGPTGGGRAAGCRSARVARVAARRSPPPGRPRAPRPGGAGGGGGAEDRSGARRGKPRRTGDRSSRVVRAEAPWSAGRAAWR